MSRGISQPKLFGGASKSSANAYSKDKPNPCLPEFLLPQKERVATDNGFYDVVAFAKPLESSKRTAIYSMHSYHQGKKPHDAIREYIRHYTSPGDLILDPFCGSGSTALAAFLEGRNSIAIDRSPAATFIAYNHCAPIDGSEIDLISRAIDAATKEEIAFLYGTTCDECDGEATINYTLYSHRYECTRCTNKVPLADCESKETITAKGKVKKVKACPFCLKNNIVEEVNTRGTKFASIPVEVGYSCKSGHCAGTGKRRHDDDNSKKRDYFHNVDLKKLEEIESASIPHTYPSAFMMNVEDPNSPWGAEWRPGRDFRTVDELFTKRNLWALASYFAAANQLSDRRQSDIAKFALTAILLAMSRMQGYVEDPRFPNQLMRGTYYLPPISREYNVSEWLHGKWSNLKRGFASIHKNDQGSEVIVSTQSASDLAPISDNIIDYIFTDPPYGNNVQYGELNFIWEAWLDLDIGWHDDEIIVNDVRGKGEDDWSLSMLRAMKECYRVLRPGRWITVCYHDTAEGTWELLQDIMAEAGFVADKSLSAVYIDTAEKSYNQRTADKVTKRDLVINYRKPITGEAAGNLSDKAIDGDSTLSERVHGIICDYLERYPGATKDRVFDEVVSTLVRSGQMEVHNFEDLLRQVADEDPSYGTSRWFIKESELSVTDLAESAKEDSAAENIAKFIEAAFMNDPAMEGVHYSDLFEHYVYTAKEKPRRAFSEWLLDYFYKTESGTYRLPSSPEERLLKAEGRAKGINRRIKRFVSLIEQRTSIADRDRPSNATLAEWIQHCKRTGLFAQGKLLFESGGLNIDVLPEVLMVNVEEDYQVCVRTLARQSNG